MAPDKPNLDTILCAAVELASAEDRAAYIARACGADHALQQRVEKLVAAHFRAGSFLESPAVSVADTVVVPLAEGPDTALGPYQVLQPIGEGAWAPSTWPSRPSRCSARWP